MKQKGYTVGQHSYSNACRRIKAHIPAAFVKERGCIFEWMKCSVLKKHHLSSSVACC